MIQHDIKVYYILTQELLKNKHKVNINKLLNFFVDKLKNEDDFKNEDDLKKEDNFKKEDNLKNEDNLKIKTNSKMKTTSHEDNLENEEDVLGLSLHNLSCACLISSESLFIWLYFELWR